MKHMMRFEIINPIVGAFESEANGWEHAQELANGAEVRLVQSRQVDQDQREVKDLQASAWDAKVPGADRGVVRFVVCLVALSLAFSIGVLVGGEL